MRPYVPALTEDTRTQQGADTDTDSPALVRPYLIHAEAADERAQSQHRARAMAALAEVTGVAALVGMTEVAV